MQYWKKENSGMVEMIEDSIAKKHPEKIKWFKNNGWFRVMAKEDWTMWSEPKKKVSKKKKK